MILVLSAITLALLGPAPAEETPLRVMSYNIHHGEGTDGKVDLPRLAQVIRNARPDLVALQEVDRNVRRSGSVDQTAELARLTGLHGSFARAIDYDGGEYGQAILSRFPIERLTIHRLPGEPEREQRIAAEVLVKVSGGDISFVTTHLHHINAEFRGRQAARLNEIFAPSDHPVILGGDLNATPESRPLEIMSGKWTLASPDRSLKTFPAGVADRKIDYVHVLPGVRFRLVGEQVPRRRWRPITGRCWSR